MWMILKNKLIQATAHQTFVIFGCHNQSYDIPADIEMGGQYNETRPTPQELRSPMDSDGLLMASESFSFFSESTFFPRSLSCSLTLTHSLLEPL